ncbi:MAG: hypothetical protein D6736_11420 [Nitrospinota bacterium]|nr:MAG: hypothetical protein D6736_11420 [Nitrospinota bacterium]
MLTHAWMAFHTMSFWLTVLFWGVIGGGILLCLLYLLRTPRYPPQSPSRGEEAPDRKKSPLL